MWQVTFLTDAGRHGQIAYTGSREACWKFMLSHRNPNGYGFRRA